MDKNKEFEQMVDRLMRDDVLEKPSIDFTQNVLEKALANQLILKKRERPLLPKWTWYLILLGVLGLMLFGFQQYSPTGNGMAVDSYIRGLGNWSSQLFSTFRFSKIVLYVVVVGGALSCFQTFVLKNYWNSKLS